MMHLFPSKKLKNVHGFPNPNPASSQSRERHGCGEGPISDPIAVELGVLSPFSLSGTSDPVSIQSLRGRRCCLSRHFCGYGM